MNKDQYFTVVTFLSIIVLAVTANDDWLERLVVLVFTSIAWIEALISSFKKD
jgi:hypothetical protein